MTDYFAMQLLQIIVTAKEPFNGTLASYNMELMVDTLGLLTKLYSLDVSKRLL